MANTFKSYKEESIGTSSVSVYTVPSGTTAVVIGFTLSNKISSQITVDVQFDSTYLLKNTPIPPGSTLSALDGKIILEEGTVIMITASNAISVDAILSVVEQT
jgi:hypothetical protein